MWGVGGWGVVVSGIFEGGPAMTECPTHIDG